MNSASLDLRPIHIPRPGLRGVRALTPFRAFQCQKMGKGRVYFDVLTIKATFDLATRPLALAEQQDAIVLSDEYRDASNAACSSVARPGELLADKPATDVVIAGTASAPGGKPTDRWEAAVTVTRRGTRLLRSAAVATGPRRFEHKALRGFRLSDPEPTTGAPIRYELAYGGWFERPSEGGEPDVHVCKANPSGSGFFDEAALDKSKSYPGPQWELAGAPVSAINEEVPLAGFGAVARMWSARLAHAGTYDDAWMRRAREDRERGVPADYPADFDPRFFQCAHPALIAPGRLAPGDVVALEGLASSPIAFALPALYPQAEALSNGQWTEEPLALDLVHVDLDAARVHLVWRLSLAPERGVSHVVIAPEGLES